MRHRSGAAAPASCWCRRGLLRQGLGALVPARQAHADLEERGCHSGEPGDHERHQYADHPFEDPDVGADFPQLLSCRQSGFRLGSC